MPVFTTDIKVYAQALSGNKQTVSAGLVLNLVENRLLKIFIAFTKYAAKMSLAMMQNVSRHILPEQMSQRYFDSSHSKIKSQSFACFLIYKIDTASWLKLGVESTYVFPLAFYNSLLTFKIQQNIDFCVFKTNHISYSSAEFSAYSNALSALLEKKFWLNFFSAKPFLSA